MRTISTIRIARATILALSIAAVAAPSVTVAQSSRATVARAIAPSAISPWAGVYRLQLTGPQGQTILMRLLVERQGDELSGTIISDDNSVAHVDLSLVGNDLRANAHTTAGEGTLLLRDSGDGVTGSFTVGKVAFVVEARRSV
jgi:hypothetical protein